MRYVAGYKAENGGKSEENAKERRKEDREKERKREKAAKGNRIYLPMRMSCRSGAISPRLVLRSL